MIKVQNVSRILSVPSFQFYEKVCHQEYRLYNAGVRFWAVSNT